MLAAVSPGTLTMKTFLPIAILTVFTATLLAAISGLLFAKGNPTALTTVAVVAACALLLVLMYDRLGEFTLGPKGASAKLIRLEEVVSDQGKRLQDQQSLVNSMVKYWMSASVFHHLCGIALLRSYIYHDGGADRREMYFLRDSGFIRPKHGAFLDFGDGMAGKNLVEQIEITEIGWNSIKLRKGDIPSNMIDGKDNLRVDPSTL
jgi:hypothetical protein